jgi:SAM-dependent methyltransferase
MSAALIAMRALLASGSVDAASARLEAAGEGEAALLLVQHPEVGRLLAALPDHDAATDPAALARVFDRLVAASPDAAVALYSLGDPDLLAAFTAEVLERLDAWGLAGTGRRVLELGCGIGRFLAPTGAIGLDISPAMLAEARRRLPAAVLVQGSGREIPFADASLDAILAVDSFPYIVQAGLAAALLAEAARVLRPGGELVILNYAYGSEAELPALAAANGFAILLAGARPFRRWDASAWRLRRRAGPGRGARYAA